MSAAAAAAAAVAGMHVPPKSNLYKHKIERSQR